MMPSSSSTDSLSADGAASPGGAAFVCDERGNVLRELHCTAGEARLDAGQTLFSSLDGPSLGAATLFLRTVAESGFARSVGLRLLRGPLVHLFGLKHGAELFVVATVDAMAAPLLCDLTAACGPEEAPALIELSNRIRGTDSSYALYAELAQLNNDLVTAQRELARTVAELRRINAYKNELLGMAAHDLRNPLNASMAFINFLYEDADILSEQNAAILDRLRRSNAFMLRLVDDVLQFSSIDAGVVRLQLEEASLVRVVGEVVETMRILADRKEIDIAFHAAEVPPVRIDTVKIAQSVQNLIGNAVKFSQRETRIDVRIAMDEAKQRVRIDVIDHGPGIPPEELHELFKPFTRLTPQPVGHERSTGLGLAITRRLIDAHGGAIEVDSEVGRGTRVSISLPISK